MARTRSDTAQRARSEDALRAARQEINRLAESPAAETFLQMLGKQLSVQTTQNTWNLVERAASPYLNRLGFFELATTCLEAPLDDEDLEDFGDAAQALIGRIVALYTPQLTAAFFADPDYAEQGHDWRSVSTSSVIDTEIGHLYTVRIWKRNGDLALIRGSSRSVLRLLRNVMQEVSVELFPGEVPEGIVRTLDEAYADLRATLVAESTTSSTGSDAETR